MNESQISGVFNARIASNTLTGLVSGLVAQINERMALAWSGDAEQEAAFFDALGNRAAAAWEKNGILINAALELGANYGDIEKPERICIKCGDGFVVPSPVAFPSTLLAVWHVPVATKDAALALLAAEAATPGAILSALVAAQPSA